MCNQMQAQMTQAELQYLLEEHVFPTVDQLRELIELLGVGEIANTIQSKMPELYSKIKDLQDH